MVPYSAVVPHQTPDIAGLCRRLQSWRRKHMAILKAHSPLGAESRRFESGRPDQQAPVAPFFLDWGLAFTEQAPVLLHTNAAATRSLGRVRSAATSGSFACEFLRVSRLLRLRHDGQSRETFELGSLQAMRSITGPVAGVG